MCKEFRNLYRAFTSFDYAHDFLNGRFRLGLLKHYQDIEDAGRVDSSEGEGHYIDANGVHEYFESGNSTYVLCCANEDVDLKLLRRKMGAAIVRISNVADLKKDISEHLLQNKIPLIKKEVMARKVEYTKGKAIKDQLDSLARWELSAIQKSANYSDEKEVRLIATINMPVPELLLSKYLNIDLNRRLPYVQLVDCDSCGLLK
jgi:hypothetical protein